MVDRERVKQLVEENLNWANKRSAWYAYTFNIPEREWDDIKAIGRIGLLRAAEKFCATRNIKFKTYAKHWIKGSIKDYLKGIPPQDSEEDILDGYENNLFYSVDGTQREVIIKDAVVKALAALPERTAFILRKHYIEGYQLKELAEPLGLSFQRVHQLKDEGLKKALKRLRKLGL